MIKPLFLFIICGAVGGCVSPDEAHQKTGPRVNPAFVMIVPDEPSAASSAEPNAALPNGSAVLISPQVIAYPIAGRVDPNHPDLMIAGGWAFRRTAPQWRLPSAPTETTSIGPATRDNRQDIRPLQNQELDTYLLEQRALNDQNRQAITRVIRLQEEMQKQLADTRHRSAPSGRPAARTDHETTPSSPEATPELTPKVIPRSDDSPVPASP